MSQDPVVKSDALDMALAENPVITNLVKIVNQHRRILNWVRFLLVVALILSGAVTWFAIRANDAAHAASSAQRANKIACNAGNDFRRTERQLWHFVLSFPPPVDETPTARKVRLEQTARFTTYVNKKFAPRNCNRLLTQASTASAPALSGEPTRSRTPSPRPASTSASISEGGGAGDGRPSSTPRSQPPSNASPPSRPSPRPSPSPSRSAPSSPPPLIKVCASSRCVCAPRCESVRRALQRLLVLDYETILARTW